MPEINIEHLRKLHKAAFLYPWYWAEESFGDDISIREQEASGVRYSSSYVEIAKTSERDVDDTFPPRAEFIVQAANIFGDLLDELERLAKLEASVHDLVEGWRQRLYRESPQISDLEALLERKP